VSARRLSRTLLGVLAVACTEGGGGAPTSAGGGRLHAIVIRPVTDSVRDTLRFEAEAVAQACTGGRSVLLDAVTGGNGVLLWLQPGDSALSGEYRYAAPEDTGAGRSAVAAVRFMAEGVSRGTVLDSGRLAVTESGARLAGRVRGSGVSNPGAVRVSFHADFQALVTTRDTVACEVAR
jgi:hypothetical protein